MQANELGAHELQLQAWGDSVQKIYSVALDLFGIDPKMVVVRPMHHRAAAAQLQGDTYMVKGVMHCDAHVRDTLHLLCLQQLQVDSWDTYITQHNRCR